MREPAMSFDRPGYQIAADVGGTFTDLVMVDDRGGLWLEKLLSTPPDFDRAVLDGIGRMLRAAGVKGSEITRVAHGTTVASNAILEHRGARTALVTTRGFRDVLELRRIRAPQIYDLFFDKPKVLIDRALRLELTERLAADGEVIAPIAGEELPRIRDQMRAEAVESVAVCLLHSYAFPQHEQRVGEYLRRELPGIPVSLSCEVVREQREYERTATTAVNAYVLPIMRRYLERLRLGLQAIGIDAPLLIMQSAGGLTPAAEAARLPVFVLESGPAGGVLGAWNTSRRLGKPNIFSFDMGGTTAKASLIEDGTIRYSSEYEVGGATSAGNRLVGGGGELILAPTVDLAEVGAGGGSIAHLDTAGGLLVGPRSAGAVPGPVCYGRGGAEPTVTDANVALGYIPAGELATGDVVVDLEAARRGIADRIAGPLGLDLLGAALGIHRIANAHMLRALREVSIQRGRDPRGFAFIAFGGSGPIHAAGLARELGVRELIVPPMPGLFSAIGMLISGVEHHDARSCRLRGESLTRAALRSRMDEMLRPMLDQFRRESYREEQVAFECNVDLRYPGQTSRIRVRWEEAAEGDSSIQRLCEAFRLEHDRLYGHRATVNSEVEAVGVRLIGRAPFPQSHRLRAAAHPRLSPRPRHATFGGRWGTIETPVVARAALAAPTRGPLLVDEYDSTIVIPPDMTARLDDSNNLIMEFWG